MSLTLTKFTQEVDIGSGLDVTYFAVFKAVDGRELRLPITKDASEALIKFMADSSPEPEDAGSIMKRASEDEMVGEEDQQFGSEFGGDFQSGFVEPDEDEAYEDSEVPESEEEVPSL